MRTGTVLFVVLLIFALEPSVLGQKVAQFYISFNKYLMENKE